MKLPKGDPIKKIVLCCLFLSLIFYAELAIGQTSFEKGLKDFQSENYEEALDYFHDAIKSEPTSTTVSFYLGMTYKLIEKNKEAVPYLRNAVTYTPRIKEALVELIDALYQTDQLDEAIKWIEVGEKEGISPGKIQFLKGLILSKQNKNLEAITAFEKAKEYDSSLSQSVEFQVATAYMKEGKHKESQQRFRAALTLDPYSDIGTYARDYENLLSDKLDRERPFRFTVGLGYKYDTNVSARPTSGPTVDNPSISPQFTGQEDFALNMTARITYVAPFSFKEAYNLSVQYAIYADRYNRRDDYNLMQQSLIFNPGYNFSKFTLTMPVMFALTWLQGNMANNFINSPVNWLKNSGYMKMLSVNPTTRFMLTENSIGEVSFGYLNQQYYLTSSDAPRTSPDENRDGVNTSGSLGWTYFFKEGAGLLSIRYSFADQEATGRNWTYTENRFSLSFLYPLTKSLKFQFSSDALFDNYKYQNTTYNLSSNGQPSMARKDNTYINNLGLIYTVYKNTDIIAQYIFTRDNSNIGTYDYKREVFSLGLEYRF
ncbi:MAG: tetratricopeptide repeat protein [Deltaproteobacteria bacterium]